MKSKKQKQKNQGVNSPSLEKGIKEEIQNSLLEKVISLGLESYLELVKEEITSICGERYKHITGREFGRWSSKETFVTLGGKKVSVKHSRVRNLKEKKERELETVACYRDKELLSERQMEQMIIGVSTRKYKRSLEAISSAMHNRSVSKSSVSRNFIAKTREKLGAWQSEPIREIYPFIMIDGIVYAKTTVLVAMGIDKKGNKKALGAWEGSTENSRVCIDLLQSLIERGFNIPECKLAIIDGGKALRKAISDVFGKGILIQRCQVHKKRNVADYLPKEKRETVRRAISEAYNTETYDTAKKLLQNIISWLDKDYPSAARSMKEGLEETLTLHKLKAHKSIRKSLSTTNPIESLNSGIRNVTRRVKRWKTSEMVMRWVYTGIIESEKNFRKINGHDHIDSLLINIGTFGNKVLEENSQAA